MSHPTTTWPLVTPGVGGGPGTPPSAAAPAQVSGVSTLSSAFLWRFLDDVWDLLPTEDRRLFEAYWLGLIQVGANLEQKVLEASQSIEVAEVPVFLTDRWNRFVMSNETTDLLQASDSFVLTDTDPQPLSQRTAFYDTFRLSNESGQIPHIETFQFFDESVRKLRYGDIIQGTVSVKLNGFEFTANRDYVVNHAEGTIQALDDGRIPIDQIVDVEYQHRFYTLDLDYTVDRERAEVARTADSVIPSATQTVVASYTYNATATIPLEGSDGSIDADMGTLTDTEKDFSTLLPDRTLTVTTGPNAGVYTVAAVLSPNVVQIAETFPQAQEGEVTYRINAFPHGIKVDRAIVSIPTLQNRIDDATIVMVEGTDYVVRDGILSVRSAFEISSLGPEEIQLRQMWAETTKLDKETPYRNFGVLIDFFRKNSEEYKLALQGLWYTFWTGSTPGNLQRGLHILLGLPFARRAGTVTLVDTETATIEITEPSGRIISYTIPTELVPVVAVGDEVDRFDSLTNGVEIIDRNNEPGFVANRLGRAGIERFLTSLASRGVGDTDETKALTLLENHLFLPQVLTEAITQRVNVDELVTFLDNMKPQWTEYVFSFGVSESETVFFSEDLPPIDLAIDLTTTVGNNPQNQADQFAGHLLQKASSLPAPPHDCVLVERVTGEIIAGGTQATGNFRDSAIDFADLGVDEGDIVRINTGLFQGHHAVLKRISSSTLSLDIPDASIIGASNIDYTVIPEEQSLDSDAINLRREHIILPGTEYFTPSTLNTKTDIDFSATTLKNEEVKTLLLVDIGIAGSEVQGITDADVENDEFDVPTPPTAPATQDHEVASAALVRTDNTLVMVTDVFAI